MTAPLSASEQYARPGPGVDAPSDRARFERMLNRHHRKLRCVVAGVVADPDRVDDVLQEAYYKAYRKLPRRFANDAHEATWLYRVTYRCCLDELRSRKRRRESASAEVHLSVVPDEGQGRVELEDALRALRPSDRAVLLLVGVLDFDYETAAAVLGVPRGTLAWRLSTARARFRDALGASDG
jgi:RNA polymerase sigma-70 factor (ECF subfamily)